MLATSHEGSVRGRRAEPAVARRLQHGPGAPCHAVFDRPWQLRSPLLFLLFATAVLSAVLGEQTNAIIIIVILFASVGLGSGNDYRAARAANGSRPTSATGRCAALR